MYKILLNNKLEFDKWYESRSHHYFANDPRHKNINFPCILLWSNTYRADSSEFWTEIIWETVEMEDFDASHDLVFRFEAVGNDGRGVVRARFARRQWVLRGFSPGPGRIGFRRWGKGWRSVFLPLLCIQADCPK